ncbi:hypothetical protein C0Q70_15802 [Pomacea canaliculata]|uniref:Reverse transcriptase domain-containing protein n=1 Tax=Pomacea canaliculata TaxID=400727 RepID=A0A2T7NVW2_POMCA|nr:hypothetical protein C0Q70_15802 [Pomacea canaliculata]
MRRTTSYSNTGVQWTFARQLDDLDFADDISLLSHKQQQAQTKLTRLAEEAAMTGLTINIKKTEVMLVNNSQEAPLQLHGECITESDRFPYLGSIVSIGHTLRKPADNLTRQPLTETHRESKGLGDSDMEEISPHRGRDGWHDMVPTGKGRPESVPMAGCGCGPVLHWDRIGTRRRYIYISFCFVEI